MYVIHHSLHSFISLMSSLILLLFDVLLVVIVSLHSNTFTSPFMIPISFPVRQSFLLFLLLFVPIVVQLLNHFTSCAIATVHCDFLSAFYHRIHFICLHPSSHDTKHYCNAAPSVLLTTTITFNVFAGLFWYNVRTLGLLPHTNTFDWSLMSSYDMYPLLIHFTISVLNCILPL